LGLALFIRLLFWIDWNGADPYNLPVVDAATFDSEARGRLDGSWPGPTPFWQAPLYSYFLSGVYALFGERESMGRLVQAVLGSITCLFTWIIARRLFTTSWAPRAAFGLVAFSGPLLWLEGQLLRETLATCLLTVGVWTLLESRARGQRWWLAAGIFLGLTAAARENALLLIPLAAAWLAWSLRDRRAAATFVLGALLPLAPITWHNAVHGRALIPISTSGGINFFLANNAQADETLAIRPGRAWRELTARPWREERRLEPAAQAAFFQREAISWIVRHPLEFVSLSAKKCFQLVSAVERKRNLDLYEGASESWVLRPLLWRFERFGFPFGLFGPFALVGLALALAIGWKRLRTRAPDGTPDVSPDRDLIAMVAAGFLIALVLFFPSARHRAPALPMLALLAIFGAQQLWLRWRAGGSERGMAIASLSVAFLCTLVAPLPAEQPGEAPFLRATRLASVGREVEAEREYGLALGLDPHNAEAWSDLAVLRGRRGDLEGASFAAERAVTVDSTYARAWSDLASVAAARRATYRAHNAYDRALRLEPDLDDARVGLARLHLAQDRLDEAETVVHEGLELSPRSPQLWSLSAVCAQRRRDPVRAESALREALRWSPREADIWNDLGVLLVREGRNDEAVSAFISALTSDPKHPFALANLRRAQGR